MERKERAEREGADVSEFLGLFLSPVAPWENITGARVEPCNGHGETSERPYRYASHCQGEGEGEGGGGEGEGEGKRGGLPRLECCISCHVFLSFLCSQIGRAHV